MVTIDQLRISDDGRLMYIDAHVNEASYFDKVYLDKVTILTEDQVMETNPFTFGNEFVYQTEVGTTERYEQVYDKTQVLSEYRLTDKINIDGSWDISIPSLDNDGKNAINFIFSGKYSMLGKGETTPLLLMTTPDFDPEKDDISDNKVIATFMGQLYDKEYDENGPVWRFEGKADIGINNVLRFCIYKTNENGSHTLIRLDQTDDVQFLHFYYMPYYTKKEVNQKEVHLVLCPNDFNETFNKGNFSDNMYFVYFTTKGTPSPNTPCRLDETTTLGVTFDYGLIYANTMCYTKELADDCSIPIGFADFILYVAALKLSIETEHYMDAIKQFEYIKNNGCMGVTGLINKPCGCNN